MKHFILATLLAAVPLPAHAALDAETAQPYQFRIVLTIGESRLLQRVFRDRVGLKLRDDFQAALGRMAKVEVVDKNSLREELGGHDSPSSKERQASIERTLALIKEVEAKGLQKALDGWREVSDTKTHFVQINFANGQYEIQTRQFDGTSGMPSPVVRRDQTYDREFVARLVALLIDHDFGMVGTLPAGAQGPEIQVELKAGKLGEPLDHWVQKDEVFAVSQIVQVGKEQRAFPLPDTLLQATETPHDGVCRCRLLTRYVNPLQAGPGVAGFRCLKLGTTEAPLRLRIVAKDIKEPPLANVQVMVAATPQGKAAEDRVTDSDGMVVFERYRTVAFVRVVPNIQIPVPILETGIVVLRVSPNQGPETGVDRRLHLWLGRVGEKQIATNVLVEDLNPLIKAKKHEQALAVAKDGLRLLDADLPHLLDELNGLSAEAAKLPAASGLDLSRAKERFRGLQAQVEELRKSIADLQEAIQTENDPKRAELKAMAAQARQEESLAEFDKAIELYKRIVKEGGNGPDFKQYATHLADLEKAWAIQGETHAQARQFIYKVWPTLKKAAELREKIDEAGKKFEACVAAKDVKTPLMILRANLTHTATLLKELEDLKGQNGADARQAREVIAEVSEKLQKLDDAARGFCKKPGN